MDDEQEPEEETRMDACTRAHAQPCHRPAWRPLPPDVVAAMVAMAVGDARVWRAAVERSRRAVRAACGQQGQGQAGSSSSRQRAEQSSRAESR
jgi:hypothetical protein